MYQLINVVVVATAAAIAAEQAYPISFFERFFDLIYDFVVTWQK